jgi:hypothetical protein
LCRLVCLCPCEGLLELKMSNACASRQCRQPNGRCEIPALGMLHLAAFLGVGWGCSLATTTAGSVPWHLATRHCCEFEPACRRGTAGTACRGSASHAAAGAAAAGGSNSTGYRSRARVCRGQPGLHPAARHRRPRQRSGLAGVAHSRLCRWHRDCWRQQRQEGAAAEDALSEGSAGSSLCTCVPPAAAAAALHAAFPCHPLFRLHPRLLCPARSDSTCCLLARPALPCPVHLPAGSEPVPRTTDEAALALADSDSCLASTPACTAVSQYPTEEMKRVLGDRIGLTSQQVGVS